MKLCDDGQTRVSHGTKRLLDQFRPIDLAVCLLRDYDSAG